jgi:hypothetical protein
MRVKVLKYIFIFRDFNPHFFWESGLKVQATADFQGIRRRTSPRKKYVKGKN